MPRSADHEARRQQVLEALCRITVRGGLDAATFREVAAEAGASVRLVQYYFGTKAALLAAGSRFALQRSAGRLLAAIERLGAEPAPRDVILAAMRSFLPTDDDAREAMILFYAFYVAQLTHPDFDRTDPVDGGAGLQQLFAHHIARGQEEGSVAHDIDPHKEAALLFLMLPSLASGAAAERIALNDADVLVTYAVNRLFNQPLSRPASRSRRGSTVAPK